jgi:hypothetical protein
LRFTFVVAAYLVSTAHSSGFARLACGAFYFAIPILTFYEIINFYYFNNLIGNHLDTTINAGQLIFSGIFDRYSNLN